MGTVVRQYLILTRSNTIFQRSSINASFLTKTILIKMKLLFVSSLALLGVDANYKAMKKSYGELAKGNRNLLTTNINNVNKYGCWCYFDDDVGNGKGEPMDLVDLNAETFTEDTSVPSPTSLAVLHGPLPTSQYQVPRLSQITVPLLPPVPIPTLS